MLSRHKFFAPLIGEHWAWQSRNCWDFACHVQRELFGRDLPHVAVLSKRWTLQSIERHAERAAWREVPDGPGGLVTAADRSPTPTKSRHRGPGIPHPPPGSGSRDTAAKDHCQAAPSSRRKTAMWCGSPSPARVVLCGRHFAGSDRQCRPPSCSPAPNVAVRCRKRRAGNQGAACLERGAGCRDLPNH